MLSVLPLTPLLLLSLDGVGKVLLYLVIVLGILILAAVGLAIHEWRNRRRFHHSMHDGDDDRGA